MRARAPSVRKKPWRLVILRFGTGAGDVKPGRRRIGGAPRFNGEPESHVWSAFPEAQVATLGVEYLGICGVLTRGLLFLLIGFRALLITFMQSLLRHFQSTETPSPDNTEVI